jgi:glycyl-tRNA synthetase
MSLLPVEEDDIYSLQAKITNAKSTIKQLKKDGAPSNEIAAATSILLACNAKFAEIQKLSEPKDPFNRKSFDELLLRKMYVVPSFEIHNGPSGLFDYGPPSCNLKSNVLNLWRRHFPQEESMLEMECTNLTPSNVLETSGHVERFTDFMVRDEKTGECFRADKLLEDVIDNLLDANPGMPQDEAEGHRIIQVAII